MLTFLIYLGISFSSNFGSLAASSKVDIDFCKNLIKKARNVSFI